MENIPIRKYIGQIGFELAKLGYEMQQQSMSREPLNFHGYVYTATENITFYLHNLSADLESWRKNMLAKNDKIILPMIFDGADGFDVETSACAVHHLLHTPCENIDSGAELTFTDELRKLEWLLEELQNKPDAIRQSHASYNDFSFDKITGDR